MDAKTARLQEERAEVAEILEESHDALENAEMALHRIQTMGLATEEMIQARYRISAALGWIKRAGHDGRWRE